MPTMLEHSHIEIHPTFKARFSAGNRTGIDMKVIYILSQMLLGLAVIIGVKVFGALSGGVGIEGQRKGKGARTSSAEVDFADDVEELAVEFCRVPDNQVCRPQ